MLKFLGFLVLLGVAFALPASPIIRKLDPLRYQHAQDDSGELRLVDLWMTLDDLGEAARYNPTAQNVYHLFTRANPSVSQPLVFGNEAILWNSNFVATRRTIVLIHGWRENVLADSNLVLIPAFLEAEDVNVLVVDWSAGANTINLPVVQTNAVESGTAVAQFIDWVNQLTSTSPITYHIVGHGLGGHQAGVVGRRVTGDVAYITGLDPSFAGWVNNPDRFHPDDAIYTEVIHTNVGINGYLADLAQVDFYPNGGESMPGCDSHACDHARSFHYFAESIRNGGFTGRRCASYLTAVLQVCSLPGTLQMGGLRPKIGFTGVYIVETNAAPPFSQG